MWLFEEPDFREWLTRRSDRLPLDDLSAALPERCISCGSDLKVIPHSEHETCGFCLAYEFGYDTHGDRIAAVVTGIGEVIGSGDQDTFKHLYRQLLEDASDALSLPLGGRSG